MKSLFRCESTPQHPAPLRDSSQLNRKRVQRLWRLEGFHVQHPNHVWVIDFQFDETSDSRTVEILNVTDKFTTETSATNVARSVTAVGTIAVLDQVREQCGVGPKFLRIDNEPEFIADTLRDWCKETNI